MTVIAAISISSCKKYIYLEPEDATYDQVFWISGTNVEKALSGAYGLLRSSLTDSRSHFIFGDFVTPEFVKGSDYWNYADLSFEGKNHFSYAPYLEGSVWDWTRFYGLINQCHLIIENTPKIDDSKFTGGSEEKKQMLGQAYFLRAYTYFYITRVWGDAVLTKESVKDPNNVQPIARSTDEEVLSYCIEDLLKAIENLQPNNATGASASYAGQEAAQALLAHVYAWQHDYTNAKKYCDLVINSGYTLEPIDTYKNIWLGYSDEAIFQVQMTYNASSNEASSGFFNVFLFNPVVNRGVNAAWKANDNTLYDYFYLDTDDRYDQVFEDGQGGTMLTKYSNINYYNPNRSDLYVVDNNLVLLRLADIYLLKAEACLKLNDEPGAINAINTVRERANATALEDGEPIDMETVYEERVREMYGEGCLAYDNIRMRLTNPDYTGNLPEPYTADRVALKGYLWPLNMRKLLPQDPLLTQNEWWKNH